MLGYIEYLRNIS